MNPNKYFKTFTLSNNTNKKIGRFFLSPKKFENVDMSGYYSGTYVYMRNI